MAEILPFPSRALGASSAAALEVATRNLFANTGADAALAAHMGAWARARWEKYQALHPPGIPVPPGLESSANTLLGEIARQYEALFHEMWLDQLTLEAQRFALEQLAR